MPGKGRGFARYTFHHAAVATQRVDIVVNHFEVGTVKVACHPFPGDRHTDARGNALAERARGGLDARCPSIFRMPCTFTVELTESFNIIERDRRVPRLLVLCVDGL